MQINYRTREQYIPSSSLDSILHIIRINLSRKRQEHSKCHSRVFYCILYAQINRVLLDRHKQELQRVVECVRRRLNQLDAIAGVESHVLMNQATTSEMSKYITLHPSRLTVQSHPIPWSTSHRHEWVYKISFQCTFRYFELLIPGFLDSLFLAKFVECHRNKPVEFREDRNHRYFNTVLKSLANKYTRKR